MRHTLDFLNSVDELPADMRRFGVTGDFVFLDQRRRTGFNFGRIEGPARYREWLAASWDLTEQRPHFSIPDVIAVRGDRCAAVVMNVDYGDGMGVEHIECWRMDASMRRADAAIAFDFEDIDVAIAELDRMYAETQTDDT